MSEDGCRRARYGEAFWRAHHEAWKRGDLNQREYCEVQCLSLKAFGNWRAKFMAEPEVPVRKLLWRRGGASHTLGHNQSHTLGHTAGHMTYPSSEVPEVPAVPPLRDGHRRRFSDVQRARILAEAARPGASVSEVARRYGIARRVLCRWRQEEAVRFVDVEIADGEMAP
ncbi:IS66 family insertion sequence element accessory protein TnpA [Defluviimonas sp. SAOS-178_SWC]|uniref:IS66 family insertion sequence element accessory protein TnpA n=1 Tax=Defluviimonas sp. SAOS-178_SWC TaxID=3121287 RepID=UPI00322183E3